MFLEYNISISEIVVALFILLVILVDAVLSLSLYLSFIFILVSFIGLILRL
jgi:hypothetical protein